MLSNILFMMTLLYTLAVNGYRLQFEVWSIANTSPVDLEDLYLQFYCKDANGGTHEEQTKGTFELKGVDNWPFDHLDDYVLVLNTAQNQLDMIHDELDEIKGAVEWFVGPYANDDDHDLSEDLIFTNKNFEQCKIELWDEDWGPDDKIATSGWFALTPLPCKDNPVDNDDMFKIVDIGPGVHVKIGATTFSCD
mmetsp:Transcript_14645/g.13153  ORF Transcript_14645/g.13153 Transcript_14645/m.13153 type:complete len:193 (-) Transcript_14645:170-748(-)